MANPQKENGFTPIANEIMEALAMLYMPSNCWRCLMFILRYIYGYFGKYCVKVSNAEISRGTGIPRQKVSAIMNSLIDHKILSVPPTGNTCEKTVTLTGNTLAKIFEFNKNYDQWISFKSVTPTGNSSVTPTGNTLGNTSLYKRKKKYNVEKPKIPFKEIITYLNQKSGKNYRPTTEKTKDVIKARFNDGFALEDFFRVIDIKCDEWLNNPEMERFIRPSTLFGNKFEGYLNQKPIKRKAPDWL